MNEVKSVAGIRAAIMKPKKEEAKKRTLPEQDKLVQLPEGMYDELTNKLKAAKAAGDKIGSGYGKITEEIRGLWKAVQIRLGGDQELLKTLSLSEGLVIVYGDGKRVDEVFGAGTFQQSKTATSKGASTWRKPWSTERRKTFPGVNGGETSLDKFTRAARIAAKSGEVAYTKALTALHLAFGKEM